MHTTAKTQSRYTPDCGEVKEGEVVACGVCGATMIEERNVNGPRSWAQAMGGGKSPHDVFECPHQEEQWHKQVVGLRREAGNSISKKLADIMLEEAEEILSSKKATKTVYFHS